MNNILVVSIYDSGWNFDACVICDNKRISLEEDYINSLRDIYDLSKFYDLSKLIDKAKELNFNGIVICEDGNIITEFFD